MQHQDRTLGASLVALDMLGNGSSERRKIFVRSNLYCVNFRITVKKTKIQAH